VSDHDFLFALDLSDEPHFDTMLGELADTVLKYVGYQPAAVEELRGAIRQALSSGNVNGQGRCDVRFRARAGELVITVAYPGRDEWRTTRPLP
jgi:predicted Zn-dependent peptidase